MAIPGYLRIAKDFSNNPEQLLAYNSTGHFVVLAGPGSGKTKVLTTKLARILHEDVESPQGVACMTYSNECARELKRRLASMGITPSRRLFVGTVHSFCFQNVVVPFAKLGGLDIAQPIRVATFFEQGRCFESALKAVIGPSENPFRWQSRCSFYRRKYIDRGHDSWMKADSEAAQVIESYERCLRSKGLIDFEDMVLLGLQLIEGHEWIRRSLAAKFPVLIVDEYQDLGLPLHRLVLALCFSKANFGMRLFAVGDADQSIYGFTGADPTLLRALSSRSDIDSVTLKLNYRSRQHIISASEIALGETRGYRSANEDIGLIEFHYCKNGLEHQARHIVEHLLNTITDNGTARSLGEVAVLYCTKLEGDTIAKVCTEHGLEFVRNDNNAGYPKTPLTRWLESAALWCTEFGLATCPSLRAVIDEYLSFVRAIRSDSVIQQTSEDLVAALQLGANPDLSLQSWLELMRETCIIKHLVNEPAIQQELVVLDDLLKAASGDGKLATWTLSRFGRQGGSPDHLNLMTLHSSKGLEFDTVILFGMDQGIIPGYRDKTPESKKEPRRLFYVGLTRARHAVHILYSGWRSTPNGQRYNDGKSEFVTELQSKLKQL